MVARSGLSRPGTGAGNGASYVVFESVAGGSDGACGAAMRSSPTRSLGRTHKEFEFVTFTSARESERWAGGGCRNAHRRRRRRHRDVSREVALSVARVFRRARRVIGRARAVERFQSSKCRPAQAPGADPVGGAHAHIYICTHLFGADPVGGGMWAHRHPETMWPPRGP